MKIYAEFLEEILKAKGDSATNYVEGSSEDKLIKAVLDGKKPKEINATLNDERKLIITLNKMIVGTETFRGLLGIGGSDYPFRTEKKTNSDYVSNVNGEKHNIYAKYRGIDEYISTNKKIVTKLIETRSIDAFNASKSGVTIKYPNNIYLDWIFLLSSNDNIDTFTNDDFKLKPRYADLKRLITLWNGIQNEQVNVFTDSIREEYITVLTHNAEAINKLAGYTDGKIIAEITAIITKIKDDIDKEKWIQINSKELVLFNLNRTITFLNSYQTKNQSKKGNITINVQELANKAFPSALQCSMNNQNVATKAVFTIEDTLEYIGMYKDFYIPDIMYFQLINYIKVWSSMEQHVALMLGDNISMEMLELSKSIHDEYKDLNVTERIKKLQNSLSEYKKHMGDVTINGNEKYDVSILSGYIDKYAMQYKDEFEVEDTLYYDLKTGEYTCVQGHMYKILLNQQNLLSIELKK